MLIRDLNIVAWTDWIRTQIKCEMLQQPYRWSDCTLHPSSQKLMDTIYRINLFPPSTCSTYMLSCLCNHIKPQSQAKELEGRSDLEEHALWFSTTKRSYFPFPCCGSFHCRQRYTLLGLAFLLVQCCLACNEIRIWLWIADGLRRIFWGDGEDVRPNAKWKMSQKGSQWIHAFEQFFKFFCSSLASSVIIEQSALMAW